ncbi:MAG: hypothetical protein Q9191_002691, partial [Dirinaria sp. TL-2023a]
MSDSRSSRVTDGPGLNTLQDHERLVKALYAPGGYDARIEDVLQRYQRSPRGWAFADELLQSQDSQVRYFGALTFIVKINNDWDTLSEADAASLLERLLDWLLRLVKNGEGRLVLRKLCSALVAYYMRPSVPWDRYVKRLIHSFSLDAVVSPEQSLDSYQSTDEALNPLKSPQSQTILWFSATFVEEVSRVKVVDPKTLSLYKKATANIDDTMVLIQRILQLPSNDIGLSEEAIQCFQEWVNYAHGVYINKAHKDTDFVDFLGKLRPLVPVLITSLTVRELFDVSVEFFTEILTNFAAFFETRHLVALAGLLASPWSQEWMLALKAGDFGGDAQDFSRLLFAYGDAALQDLARHPLDGSYALVLDQLLVLLNCAGYDGAEMQISSQAVEFWQLYTEHVTGTCFTQEEEQVEPILELASARVAKALEIGLARIRFPSEDMTASWDSETRSDFGNLRRDLQDLVQASFPLLGQAVFATFAKSALDALRDEAWPDVEAALFCLNGLSDSCAGTPSEDAILASVFGSPLFSESAIGRESSMPEHTQQTVLDTITNYTAFFGRHGEHLPSVFRYLFGCLNNRTLAVPASKAIASTCSLSRHLLVNQVNEFLGIRDSLQMCNAYVKEKIVGAIAMIIQALPKEEDKIGPLSNLLTFVEADAAVVHKANECGRLGDGVASGVCALDCLASIARAVQVPDSDIVDLERDPGLQQYQWGVWQTEMALLLQARVIRLLLDCTRLLKNDSNVISSACQVLRAGYKESNAGLFVLPTSVSTKLLEEGVEQGFDSPRLNYLLDTVGTMLNSRRYAPADIMRSSASETIRTVLFIIRRLDNTPERDPEIAASCIDVAAKTIPVYIESLFDLKTLFDLPNLFRLTLTSLTMREIMPKRAAASFWALFILHHTFVTQSSETIQSYLAEFGPRLCHVLIRNISGEGFRSDMDILAEPLKRLAYCHPMARQWLQDALFSPSFTSQKVGDQEKIQWLQKIL